MAESRAKRRRMRQEDEDIGQDAADLAEEMAAAGLVAVVPGKVVNNVAGLKTALRGFRQKLPWMERLDVTSGDPLVVPDVNDDLQRELQFYNQALAAVKAARTEWDRLGHVHFRPDDYFAEMLKSDSHMTKVKKRLLAEQKRMEAFEERRRGQAARKFSKAVQAERTKSRAADKKSSMAAIDAWRKTKASRGGAVVDEASSAQLEAMLSSTGHDIKAPAAAAAPKRGEPAGKPRSAEAARRAGRRSYKNAKYGFGGKKRFAKSNDAKSSNDLSGFSSSANRALPRGFKGTRKPSASGAARPGKRRRAAMRGGK